MNISGSILDEARRIVRENPDVVLPAEIRVGRAKIVFYVALQTDETITPHTTIDVGEQVYIIGTKKEK